MAKTESTLGVEGFSLLYFFTFSSLLSFSGYHGGWNQLRFFIKTLGVEI